MTEVLTMEQWIRKWYPPPKEADEQEWAFYQAWGYEQWLIKRYQKSLEQIKILVRQDYNTYRIAAEIERAGGQDKFLVGLPLVRAKHIVRAFMCASMPKGTVGVALWQESDEDWFCIWPKYVASPWPQIKGSMSKDDIEFTGETYTNEQALLNMQPKNRPAYPFHVEDRIVDIPEVGVKYVKTTYSGGVSRHVGGMTVIEAVRGKTVEWKRKPNAKEELIYISNEQFENIRILR